MLIFSVYVLFCWVWFYLAVKDRFISWQEALDDWNAKTSVNGEYVSPMWLFVTSCAIAIPIVTPFVLVRSLFRKLF